MFQILPPEGDHHSQQNLTSGDHFMNQTKVFFSFLYSRSKDGALFDEEQK